VKRRENHYLGEGQVGCLVVPFRKGLVTRY
jgi:hypothetical protein